MDHCPSCGKNHLEITMADQKTPHLEGTVSTSLVCPNCGFRHNDVTVLNLQEPKAYQIQVRSVQDLNAKIIRSSSGYIKIPELDVEITPGPYSQSFISNVKGLLNRVEENLKNLIVDFPRENKNKGDEFLLKLEKAKKGEMPITIILRDPNGSSRIEPYHGVKVRVRKLSQKEIDALIRF